MLEEEEEQQQQQQQEEEEQEEYRKLLSYMAGRDYWLIPNILTYDAHHRIAAHQRSNNRVRTRGRQQCSDLKLGVHQIRARLCQGQIVLRVNSLSSKKKLCMSFYPVSAAASLKCSC